MRCTRHGRGVFSSARDCKIEVRELEDKVKQKRDINETKKREKSWENEVAGLRKEWEWANVMMNEDKNRLKDELVGLRRQLDE